MEESGDWIPLNQLSDFHRYSRIVWSITNKQNISSLENYERRGRIFEDKDSYHLDHKFSIKEGFLNCILPIYIGSLKNLEFIPGLENIKKSAKCSIDLDDLF